MRTSLLNILLLALLSCSSATSTDKGRPAGMQRQNDTPAVTKPAADEEIMIPYETYCNSRFGYCIDYPAKLVTPQPESDNRDGRIFTGKNDEEVLRVFGRYNPDPDVAISMEQQYNTDLQRLEGSCTITYKKLGKAFYVISGYTDDRIFYRKTILLEDDALAYAILQYNKSDKQVFDKASEKIFRSFK